MIPPSLTFRLEREGTWRELERIVAKAEGGNIRSIGPREMSRLPLLYRSTLASLSVARGLCLDGNLLEYLENLSARAYIALNASRPRFWHGVGTFLSARFPTLVRRYRRHVLLSALVMLLGVGVGFVLTLDNPERFYNFVPEAYAQGRDPTASTASLRSALYDTSGVGSDQLAMFSSFLLSNNAKVGMLCFALGFAFGIPVAYLLFSNGLVLGAFAALYHSRGLGTDFWGWVLPHGVTEIFAVILCGGAGFAMAQSVIFPGRRRRIDNISAMGRSAGVIVLGSVALFFAAALIEGFFRQLVLDINLRFLMIVVTTVLLAAYFVLAGRREVLT